MSLSANSMEKDLASISSSKPWQRLAGLVEKYDPKYKAEIKTDSILQC